MDLTVCLRTWSRDAQQTVTSCSGAPATGTTRRIGTPAGRPAPVLRESNMFSKVLIANRGAIAVRILRTLRRLGIGSVAIYAEADRESLHVLQADEAFSLGEGGASDTYLDAARIIAIARDCGAEAIHPGYGFLSESAAFVEACEAAELVFLGPRPHQIRAFGLKHAARELAEGAGVPLVPGSGLLRDVDEAVAAAAGIGYPVMLKSTAGGGGIGMQVCDDAAQLRRAFDSVRNLGQRNFADGGVFLERYIARARHLEVQLFGDGEGGVLTLGERDCSTQRRNQKVVEETPAPRLPQAVREQLLDVARRLGEAVCYRSAGTVEFIYDAEREDFFFLEVNTRLQVEHGVTEEVWGVDLVEWMLRLGAGELPPLPELAARLTPRGHAIQVRLYAEDPNRDYRPSAGLLTEVAFAQQPGLRVDHWLEAGIEVPALFDPMLAKLIVHADDRDTALRELATALRATRLYGIECNRAWLAQLLEAPAFRDADLSTRWLQDFHWAPPALEVLTPGTLTTIQDVPGRRGHWDVGIPPSGPFDDWAFRLGNTLLGNPAQAAGLEITVSGPSLRFFQARQVLLAGAELGATLDGEPLPWWTPVQIPSGAVLSIGKAAAQGARAYLLVAGGLDCPAYLGSRSTFTLGQFGGHAGRALRAGDVLHLHPEPDVVAGPAALPEPLRPVLAGGERVWEVGVLYGPHGAPDFFTDADIARFFGAEWEVHYNSSRTGVRLIGPKPEWARADGGEAGLHPSNIHDNAYAFGSIDFTGDMPVILGPDGPSLGGFVCPAVVVRAERWKLGQLRAGDRLRFIPLDLDTARALEQWQDDVLAGLATGVCDEPAPPALGVERGSPVLRDVPAAEAGERVVYRRAGDDFLLIEFGPMALDIALRFRAHAWMLWLQRNPLPGVLELTPGVRSLQVHFEPRQLTLSALLQHLQRAEAELREVDTLEVPARVVHLPLSWNDPACREAVSKYQRSVRPGAPWCSENAELGANNLEFIRRINDLGSIDDVRRIVFDAAYLVMGLGDVYLGAPVATPLDPRHRLVTTKYNPARTWTAENSVGIGGAYLCVYGMEGPGGYQFVGRTLQMWNRYHRTREFEQPWLLRFFDQIRFFAVSEKELAEIRRDFPRGRYPLRIEPTHFRLADYQAELDANHEAIAAFTRRREAAFQREMAHWRATGQLTYEQQDAMTADDDALVDGETGIESPVAGSLWRYLVAEGDRVEAGQAVALVESMKMEVEVFAPEAGTIARLPLAEGAALRAGQVLVVAREVAPAGAGQG